MGRYMQSSHQLYLQITTASIQLRLQISSAQRGTEIKEKQEQQRGPKPIYAKFSSSCVAEEDK